MRTARVEGAVRAFGVGQRTTHGVSAALNFEAKCPRSQDGKIPRVSSRGKPSLEREDLAKTGPDRSR
jgi:hypothetical protein